MPSNSHSLTRTARESSFVPFLRVWLPESLWQERWLRARSLPAERVMMFHIGRSGSTVLADMLDQHPQIDWAGEVVRKLYAPFERRGWSVKPPVTAKRLLLDSMAQVHARIYGCEMKFFHVSQLGLTLNDYMSTVEGLGFQHFIVLERRNYLRKIVSSLVAKKRGKYRQPAGIEPDLTRIAIDLQHVRIDGDDKPLLTLLQSYASDMCQLDNLLAGKHVLRLSYEDDILSDPQAGYRRACEFLGVPIVSVSIRYGRSNPFPLSEIISNYEDVAAALAGTEFVWMLERD